MKWEQVGTVELLALRVYPIDPYASADLMPIRTEVAVEPGIYPVYRKYDAYRWVMRGRINERTAKIGDGLFAMNNGDVPSGLEVQFPSLAFGSDQFAEFLTESICQPGPMQRLRFNINEMETL